MSVREIYTYIERERLGNLFLFFNDSCVGHNFLEIAVLEPLLVKWGSLWVTIVLLGVNLPNSFFPCVLGNNSNVYIAVIELQQSM